MYLVTWCLSNTNESNGRLCQKCSVALLLPAQTRSLFTSKFKSPLWPTAQVLGNGRTTSEREWFSDRHVKLPSIHTIKHLVQPCLWANQRNKHTKQTQVTGLPSTCSQTASSLKGKTDGVINVCSKPINDSGNRSSHFPCWAILDCIILRRQASIFGLAW